MNLVSLRSNSENKNAAMTDLYEASRILISACGGFGRFTMDSIRRDRIGRMRANIFENGDSCGENRSEAK